MGMGQLNSNLQIRLTTDAEVVAQELHQAAVNYQEQLDANQEVGLLLASFGQAVTVQITGIGHVGKMLIKFKGNNIANGQPVELLQHISQVNFLLTALSKRTEEPKKQIGFITG